jgi:uncharacterized protein GlcG (DUF336 family)
MSARIVSAVGVALALAVSSASHAQVIGRRDVSAHMATAIVAAAVAKCEKDGGGLTVAVVGRQGEVRALLVADDARPHHVELAQRKAYTALTARRTSADWTKATEPGSQIAGQRSMAKVIPLSGGVPIKAGDETIGAVGVSGSATEQDEVCAFAGLAGVADQLK